MDCSVQTRRRRRSVNPKNAAYAAAIIFFCIYHDVGLAKSFRYRDRNLLASYTPKSLLTLRCGGGISDEIDLQTSSHLESLQIDQSTLAAPDRTIIFANIGKRPPSKGLWRRIRLLRGGVEDETDEDGIDDVEHQGASEPATNSTTSSNGTSCVETPANVESKDEGSSSKNITSEEENGEILKQTNQGGGVFYSFFSLFRASVESSEEPSETPINTTGIAHKIPHGPDGRGGGGSVMAMPQPTAEEESKEHDKEEEFVISTDVTEVSMNATAAKTVNLAKSTSKASGTDRAPMARKGADSTAFVVPPSNKPLPMVDDEKGEDAKKGKSKTPKGKPIAVKEDVATLSSNTSLIIEQNETGAVKASNDTLSNSTVLSSTNKSSLPEESPDNIQMLQRKDYTSSGYWTGIDLVASLGLSTLSDDLKISRALRPMRKAVAKATGLHGLISGKNYGDLLDDEDVGIGEKASTVISIDEELGIHDANALEAEMLARRVASRNRRQRRDNRRGNNNRPGRRWGFRRGQQAAIRMDNIVSDYVVVPALDTSPDALEHRRRKRVEEIDRLLQRGSERLLELQCERDDLLCAPNPLFNYTKKNDPSANYTFGDVRTTREFNFPSSELVNEYIGELVSHGRLIRLNHTELWQSRSDDGMDDEDEIVGDDLLTPGADVRKLYENLDELEQGMGRNGNRNKSGGGSWLLRTGFGRNGGSLGEKLGETIEIAAYKGVCSSVMMVFARMLSGLHGVNILSHSDIRTYVEQEPDLPPMDKKYGPLGRDSNYAQEAIKKAIQKGAKKKRKTGKHHSSHRSSTRHHGHELSDDAFIQRDAVVETLISHCQISAPLLKLFPLDWQRAMVGNIITLATAIVSDFAEGLKVQILGHALTVSFKPITEADMIQHIGVGGFRHNHRRKRPDEFEAAVLATALDISESLSFLDGWLEWFERRVGGGVLRSQIGNLIARVVLTLVDEVLSGARLDLWSSQANGPRLYAALEYRTSSKVEEQLNE